MNKKKHYYITNQNDMYIYTEIINQAEPRSVLDIGMFLKRCGALARNLKDHPIPVGMTLDGVDFAPEIKVPVYGTIYDSIQSYDSFRNAPRAGNYDLVFMLAFKDILNKSETISILKWAYENSKHIVVSGSPQELGPMTSAIGCLKASIKPLHVDSDEYCIINCKNKC